MPFTFRPSVGADVIIAGGAAGLLGIDFYNESGNAIVLTRNLFGTAHQFVPGGASVTGTAGSDTLFGNDSAATPDVLFWDPTTVNQLVSPSDFVTPFSNNAATSIDVVMMGAGNDFLTLSNDVSNLGNPGTYTLGMTGYGGDGNDILWMAAGNDAIFGDAGDDVLAGQAGNDIIQGGAGFDSLFGGSGADLLRFDGNDVNQGGADLYQVAIWTGAGANPTFTLSLAGGSGYAWSRDLFDGGTGTDTLQLTNGNDLLLMNAQDLTINGIGQSGNGNQLTAIEVIEGQAGNDVISVNNAAGGVAFAGALSISGGAGFDLIVSGNGDDLITGGNFVGAMSGGDRDTAYGGGGNDRIYGDSQDDPLNSVGGGIDTLYGGAGNDTVYGGAASDTVFGDGNQDTLYGGTGDDSVYGGTNADVLYGDLGIDRLFGGDVSDTLAFSTDANIAAAAADDGVRFWTGEGPVTTNFHVFSSDANRSFDSLDGGAGIDTFIAGSGNDVLLQNSSALVIDNVSQAEGAGRIVDIEVFVMGGGADVLVLNDAANGTDYTTAATVFGGSLNDLIVSGSGNDRISGGNPSGSAAADAFDTDTIYGGAGDDVIFGDRENRETSLEGAGDTLYGGGGDDTIFGDAGADRLFGGVGADSLSGGTGDDLLAYERDADVEGQLVVGWDGGHPGSQILEIVLEPGTTGTLDTFIGGDGFDTVDLRNVSTPGNRVYFGAQAGVPIASFISGIEMIYAGAAADVINLSRYEFDIDEYDAYTSDITVVGGGGGDVVFSGSGSDRIYGDHLAGTLSDGDGSDTLFGGTGNDIIYGDSVDGQQDGASVGDDVLFGGGGNDAVYGGRGNDSLVDIDDSSLYGGDGSDLLVLSLSGVFATGVTHGGDESDNEGDGDDRVFVDGYYESVTAGLGGGNDLFISLATGDNGEGEGGAKTDRVSGGTGDDVVSTWFGDDTIDGGSGGDALWGGAGVDTILGGPGSDYLYGGGGGEGEGGGDVLIGGDGSDYYYWAHTDGIDRVDDQDTVAGGEGDNYILVFSGYDDAGQFPAGSGVFETDNDLYDNAGGDDMVQITLDPDGDGSTQYIMTILQGEGAGSQLYFDSDEISVIGLWNNDAVGGTPVITAYVWDPIDGRYEYQP